MPRSKNLSKISKLSWFAPICVALLLVLGASIVILRKTNENTRAAEFTYDCDSSDPESLSCLQGKYSTIARTQGVQQAINQLKTSLDSGTDANGNNCHEIAHAIGREALGEYKTLANAFAHGSNICDDGYYHGVMEAIAKNDGTALFNKTFTTICNDIPKENNGSSLGYLNCIHGVGHGLMVTNNNNVFSVVKLCDKLASQAAQQQCYYGAFMENVVLIAEGDSQYLKSNDLQYPCDAVADQYKSRCYWNQGLVILASTGSYSKALSVCTNSGKDVDLCYQGVGHAFVSQGTTVAERTARTIENCNLKQDQAYQQPCIAGYVFQNVADATSNEAQDLCASLPPGTLQSYCYKEISDDKATFN